MKDEQVFIDVRSVPGWSSVLGLQRQTGQSHRPQENPQAKQEQDKDTLWQLCPEEMQVL